MTGLIFKIEIGCGGADFAKTEDAPKPKYLRWTTFFKAKDELYELGCKYWTIVDL
ncbi:hypothetical protein [Psychromonas ingrahamii]|uniref:hypothetical protein n=1 Tax=Psychromonas ingrahamii TaxID=357794 RepID=UPI0002F8A2EF|nr:hypothetical protein [Psychromonas ingrahamii]